MQLISDADIQVFEQCEQELRQSDVNSNGRRARCRLT